MVLSVSGSLDGDALARVAASGDVRQAWLLSDLLRFTQTEGEEGPLVEGDDGDAVAFPRNIMEVRYELRTRSAFDAFTCRALSGPLHDARVRLLLDGDGFRAVDRAGRRIVAHEASGFSWRQFNTPTAEWIP